MIQVSAATTTISPKRMVKAVGNFFIGLPCVRGRASLGVPPEAAGPRRLSVALLGGVRQPPGPASLRNRSISLSSSAITVR